MKTFEHLTGCEKLIIKTIWDADEELSLMEIVQRVNDKYHKNWKPQTVSTFLAKLRKKRIFEILPQRKTVPLQDFGFVG